MAHRPRASGPDEGAPSFEAAIDRLESIVEELADGELDLETALRRFEEGVSLSRECARRLEEARQRVDVLLREGGEGEWVERPFEDPATMADPDGPAEEES